MTCGRCDAAGLVFLFFYAGVCDGCSVTVKDSWVPRRIDGRIDADGVVWRWALHVQCEEGWALQLMLEADVNVGGEASLAASLFFCTSFCSDETRPPTQ